MKYRATMLTPNDPMNQPQPNAFESEDDAKAYITASYQGAKFYAYDRRQCTLAVHDEKTVAKIERNDLNTRIENAEKILCDLALDFEVLQERQKLTSDEVDKCKRDLRFIARHVNELGELFPGEA